MIPITWLAGGLALAVAVSGASGYVAGRKAVRGEMDALRQSYAIAAAQAAGREAERGRMWQQALTVAGDKFNERIEAGNGWTATREQRLRDAAATSERVYAATTVTPGCPAVNQPRLADVLAASREIVALARDADAVRAAALACISAWPQ